MSVEKYFSHDTDDCDEDFPFTLNEREWHSYLAAIDAEAGKFFRLFVQSRHVSNHLDVIFAAMKWRRITFSGDDAAYNGDQVEVVTFHKNPVNIASKAIFFFMEKIWDFLLASGDGVAAPVCWNFAKLMNTMRTEMISGIANIDALEYMLSVCHFKNVMAAVNAALSALKKLPCADARMRWFASDFTTALFDIRELAWQSIVLCTVAEKRCNDGRQF
jgi:hypothetical protein